MQAIRGLCCLKAIDQLVLEGANVNAVDPDGRSVLMHAASHGPQDNLFAIPCCRLLIEAGADVNVQNKAGETALSCAVQTKNIQVIKVLLNAGALVNVAAADGGNKVVESLLNPVSRTDQNMVALLQGAGEMLLDEVRPVAPGFSVTSLRQELVSSSSTNLFLQVRNKAIDPSLARAVLFGQSVEVSCPPPAKVLRSRQVRDTVPSLGALVLSYTDNTGAKVSWYECTARVKDEIERRELGVLGTVSKVQKSPTRLSVNAADFVVMPDVSSHPEVQSGKTLRAQKRKPFDVQPLLDCPSLAQIISRYEQIFVPLNKPVNQPAQQQYVDIYSPNALSFSDPSVSASNQELSAPCRVAFSRAPGGHTSFLFVPSVNSQNVRS